MQLMPALNPNQLPGFSWTPNPKLPGRCVERLKSLPDFRKQAQHTFTARGLL